MDAAIAMISNVDVARVINCYTTWQTKLTIGDARNSNLTASSTYFKYVVPCINTHTNIATTTSEATATKTPLLPARRW